VKTDKGGKGATRSLEEGNFGIVCDLYPRMALNGASSATGKKMEW
jgi:hypothetical protein